MIDSDPGEKTFARPSLWLVVVGFLLALTVLVGRAAAADDPQPVKPPEEPVVVRVYYDDINQIPELSRYDLWEYNNRREGYVLVAVNPSDYARLQEGGWRIAVDPTATARLLGTDGRQPFLEGYRTVAEIYAHLQTVADAYPNLTELVTYGRSHCAGDEVCTTPSGEEVPGHDLLALRISNEGVPGSSTIVGDRPSRGSKPVFILLAGVHAREITTPELALRFGDMLLSEYGRDADITWIVDHHEVWIIPTANPDGHWLVELGAQPPYSGAFFQRKNANQDADANGARDCDAWPPETTWQYGVDLNRNHSFEWAVIGGGKDPCDQSYAGAAAASEAEVIHLEALVSALIADQRGPNLTDAAPSEASGLLISLHSYSELVLWPWSFTDELAPNAAELEAIASKLATYNGYTACRPADCLYAVSGTTDEWAYGALGIPAFTFEVGQEFMPPFAEFETKQWPENRYSLLYAARIAGAPYQLVYGPDVLLPSARVTDEGQVVLTATVDDGSNGGQTVAAARYSVGVPPWAAGATVHEFAPADGFWDSTQEQVSATVTLEPGQRIVYFQGRDGDGNWGPVSAAFVDTAPAATTYVPFVGGAAAPTQP